MIRKDGYYISEAFPWIDWHAGHKFEGLNYKVIKFLNDNSVITHSSNSKEISNDFFNDRMDYIDKYVLLDDSTLEITFNPQSKWNVIKQFTILSPEVLLDENLKEYRFIPINTSIYFLNEIS